MTRMFAKYARVLVAAYTGDSPTMSRATRLRNLLAKPTIVGMIGPDDSGKTTFFERITDSSTPTSDRNVTLMKVLAGAITTGCVSTFTFDAYGNIATYTDAERRLIQDMAHSH